MMEIYKEVAKTLSESNNGEFKTLLQIESEAKKQNNQNPETKYKADVLKFYDILRQFWEKDVLNNEKYEGYRHMISRMLEELEVFKNELELMKNLDY